MWQAYTFDGSRRLCKNNEWGCIPHPILFDHNRSLFDLYLMLICGTWLVVIWNTVVANINVEVLSTQTLLSRETNSKESFNCGSSCPIQFIFLLLIPLRFHVIFLKISKQYVLYKLQICDKPIESFELVSRLDILLRVHVVYVLLRSTC